MRVNETDRVDKRLYSGEIIEQKNWKFIKELNSCSEERLNSVAVVDGKREYTYRQLFRKWENYAGVFSALGLVGKNHTRVAMTGLPCAETIAAYYALNMTGASVSMVFSSDLKNPEEWGNVVRQEGITDLILTDHKTEPELLHRIMRERNTLGIRNVIVMKVPICGDLVSCAKKWEAEQNYESLREYRGVLFLEDLLEKYADHPVSYSRKVSADDAVIVHTSGTTRALHKPVPMSDIGINESAARLLRDDRFDMLRGKAVSVLSLNVSLGYSFFEMMSLPLAFGGKVITLPASESPRDTLETFINYGGNVLFSVPAVFDALSKLPVRLDFSEVKFVFMGAAYIPIESKKRYDKFLKECGTDTKVSVGYGLTEIGGACILAPEDTDKSTIGYPLPGVKVKIRDEVTGEYFDIEDGPRTGGLLISSRGLSSGRLDKKVIFELTDIDGESYLDTNDLVDVNEDGSLSFVGRTNKYFVNQKGVRFDAGLVETALSEQPGIESCGLAPIFEKYMHDTVPVLYVQMTADTEKPKAALRRALLNVFVRDAKIKDTNLPYSCVITDDIPYNEAGKVDVHKILNNEIKGETYVVKAEYRGDELENIKLVSPDDMTRQVGFLERRDNQ